jgi:hypothetical protein
LIAQRLAFRLGLFGDRRQRLLEGSLVGVDLPASGRPLQVVVQGLHLVDLVGDLAVALSLAGLAPYGVQLRFDLADQVGEPPEIGFGGLQPQFRLVAAAMQAGDAGGVLKHAAALLRRGIDDFADAPLLHQRRRPGARGGIFEQEPDVAGAHVLAVDLVSGARFALDPPRHLEQVGVVELGWRQALAVVEE